MTNSADLDEMCSKQLTNIFRSVFRLVAKCSYVSKNNIAFIWIV